MPRSREHRTQRVSGWVRAVPILAAFIVGAASFTLSFFAQAEVATELGAVPGRLSWLVPIVVDGGILAGSAAVWSSSTRRARKDPVAYLTVAALLGLSVVVNVDHAADGGGLLGAVIAGAPPVVLLLCLELVAAQARRDARDLAEDARTTSDTAPAAAPVPLVYQPSTAAAPAHVPSTSEPRPAAPPPAPEPEHRAEAAAPQPAPDLRAAQPTTPTTAHRPPTPQRPAVRPPAGKQTPQKARIQEAFAAHIAEGGDPADPSLTRRIAETLGAPVPSVRKVLGEQRRALAEAQ